MKSKNAYTLIEIAAVSVIITILLGISLSFLNSGSSFQEAKITANSIHTFISLAKSMATSAGKIYAIDLNCIPTSSKIQDPSSVVANLMYRFNVMAIYSCNYSRNATQNNIWIKTDKILEIPVTIGAYINIDDIVTAPTERHNDFIYFKPDGSISLEAPVSSAIDSKIIICPDKNINQWYKINMSNRERSSGLLPLTSFKD